MTTTSGLHTVLGDLDGAIGALFVRELGLRGLDGTQVSFDAPTPDWAEGLAGPTLDLYLYDVKESLGDRRVEWERREVNGRTVEQPPPVLIEASYVITGWAETPEAEHSLLSAALAIAYSHPELPDDVRMGALAEEWRTSIRSSRGRRDRRATASGPASGRRWAGATRRRSTSGWASGAAPTAASSRRHSCARRPSGWA